MKYLHLNEIPWEYYHVIGFDMDGTLYAEESFVSQVYEKVAQYLASSVDVHDIYEWMISRWRIKGSSYPFIFSETIEKFHLQSDKTVEECLMIYRKSELNLTLSDEVIDFLNQIAEDKEIFLISDGHHELQKRKFVSLGLERWFLNENVFFTGKLGSNYYKPDVASIKYISCLEGNKGPNLYVGDREMDEQFALNAGFDFVKVENFYEFWEVSK